MFKLSIKTDNDAFSEDSRNGASQPGLEIARILRGIASRLENGQRIPETILDANGNKVGTVTFGKRN